MKRNEPLIRTTNALCCVNEARLKRLRTLPLHLRSLAKAKTLRRNQIIGCQELGVKGGFDYKRVCRNLGGNSVLSWLWVVVT